MGITNRLIAVRAGALRAVSKARAMVLAITTAMAVALPTALLAVEPVRVTEATISLPTKQWDFRKGADAHKPDKKTPARESMVDIELVKVNNGIVEAWIAPKLGARLLRAIDLQTGSDYFWWSGYLDSHLPWAEPGGVKASWPFFEHGTHMHDQVAGYRVVTHDDGSVTVAHDTRFTQYQTERERSRYGRWADEYLNVMITIKPGDPRVYWHQRKENPNPLPRGDRFWNDVLYAVQQKMVPGKINVRNPEWKKGAKGVPKKIEVDAEVPDVNFSQENNKFLYPIDWVVDHGPTAVHTSPHWSELDNWNISHFSMVTRHPFCGHFDVQGNINRLRIASLSYDEGNACKLYTHEKAAFCEFWGGVGLVFEKTGNLQPGYEPVEFTHQFWTTFGIGQVDLANAEVAIAIDGKNFALVTALPGQVEVVDGRGQVVASGEATSHQPVHGSFDGSRIIVRRDETVLIDRVWPDPRPEPVRETQVPADVQAQFDALVARDPFDLEKECLGTNHHPTNDLRVRNAIGKVTAETDAVRAMSLARAAYRWGYLDQVTRVCELFPGPEADLLLGLLALEKGQQSDFGQAGAEADYLRALVAIANGQTKEAVQRIDSYLQHAPKAYRPRLTRAYLTKDLPTAQTLANENLGSPEAQLVLSLLGDDSATAALQQLLRENVDADKHVELYRRELQAGAYHVVSRFQPEVTQVK